MDNTQIAIIVSIITTGVSIVAMQCKKAFAVRCLQLLSNSLLVLQYIITDNISASGVCIAAIVHVLIAMYFQNRRLRFPIPLMLVFVSAYIAITVLSYEKPPDVLSGVAACLFALAVIQTKTEYYRILATLNCLTWLVFDIWSQTYSAVILHGALLVIDIFTIVRIDGAMWRAKLKSRFAK